MSIKNELILSYIKELEVGTKLSVRRLSELLDVSEGTVYKAIKTAEAQGLVVTKPKSGTFRVDAGFAHSDEKLNLKRIAKLLGLTTVVEPPDSGRIVERIIICDGSDRQLEDALSGCSGGVLCLVGKRPDIQELIVAHGADMLLTGGASADPITLIRAERQGLCVMSALQDSYTVLKLLEGLLSTDRADSDAARVWMKAPDYLYSNDVVADWHKLCESAAPPLPVYPVVDEDLRLCGALDVPRAFAANPSQRISGILRPAVSCIQFDEDTPVYKIAEEMILSGRSLAAIVSDERMNGTIDANDLLRYFIFSGSTGHAPMFESFLESADVSDNADEKYYNIRFPQHLKADPAEFTLPVVLAAAHRHAAELLGAGCVVESGTFFASKTIDSQESLMLSSKLTRRGEQGCTLEEEIFGDSCSYTKAILMFTAQQSKEDGNV